MAKRTGRHKKRDKLGDKPSKTISKKKRSNKAVNVDAANTQLDQERAALNNWNKKRNTDSQTTNYLALGGPAKHLNSSPFQKGTKVKVKRKYYKLHSNK